MRPVIGMRVIYSGLLLLFLSAFSSSGLSPLVIQGDEMHPSLATPRLDDRPAGHVSRDVLRDNPQLSSDAAFIRAIASSGSQGELNEDGIRTALYALYVGESDVGLYGLEAASEQDANRLERALRDIWSHNVSIDRAQVHRKGLSLVVVWTDGVAQETWEAVNRVVVERLNAF